MVMLFIESFRFLAAFFFFPLQPFADALLRELCFGLRLITSLESIVTFQRVPIEVLNPIFPIPFGDAT